MRPPADPAVEYRAAREGAALLTRPSGGVLEATGADRVRFLHGLLSNDIKNLEPGQACRAALLDSKARVLSLVSVLAEAGRLLIETPSGGAAKVQAVLERFIISEDVALRDASADWTILTLVGPKAEGLLPSAPCVGVRTDELVLPTFDVWCAAPAADAAREALLKRGASLLGEAAYESLRVEAGAPAFGRDVDESVLLPEAGLEDRVSYDKGCYLGQETVARVKYRGHVNRALAGLVVEGSAGPRPGDVVRGEGKELGRVTSAAWSFGFGGPLALAYLRRESLEPGLSVEIEGRAGRLAAQVSSLPFPVPSPAA
jgi:tRNA-modifying protein YgfZ